MKNKKIAGYGASATSTTLIYHYELNKILDYLVDDFKAKINLLAKFRYHILIKKTTKRHARLCFNFSLALCKKNYKKKYFLH